MTKEEAAALGYRLIWASTYEVGLLKDGRGLRTWWIRDFGFDHILPELDHPLIQKAIAIHEDQ